jgi:hypothetical protein
MLDNKKAAQAAFCYLKVYNLKLHISQQIKSFVVVEWEF